MHVDLCVFHNGVHVYAGPNCPHDRAEDETGPIQPPGWTAVMK
jgi:hypothetical protein